ncbi:MAG TPA: ornithine carbamoyltransferase [Dehalococcoidales bacterium]|nr:ornithine carbamoyltransferase [Dehalococcoidales bacterium]
MQGKDLISMTDLSREEVKVLISDAIEMKQDRWLNILENKTLALVFEKPSLRTRVSFELAMKQLGGHCIYLSPAEVGLGKRESIRDVAEVLSRYADAIAARTFAHTTLVELGRHASVPVINALDDIEHPCQALADLLTIYEKKEDLKNVTVAYIGDGNNVAHSLMLGCAMLGAGFRIASPPGYQISETALTIAREYAAGSGCELLCTHKPLEAAAGADVVYTDVWTSMGQEVEAEKRRSVFSEYKITQSLMKKSRPDAIFMHPLPAHHGEEVEDEVLYSPYSVVFDQAENRLHIQKALLAQMLGGLDIFLPRHK